MTKFQQLEVTTPAAPEPLTLEHFANLGNKTLLVRGRTNGFYLGWRNASHLEDTFNLFDPSTGRVHVGQPMSMYTTAPNTTVRFEFSNA